MDGKGKVIGARKVEITIRLIRALEAEEGYCGESPAVYKSAISLLYGEKSITSGK